MSKLYLSNIGIIYFYPFYLLGYRYGDTIYSKIKYLKQYKLLKYLFLIALIGIFLIFLRYHQRLGFTKTFFELNAPFKEAYYNSGFLIRTLTFAFNCLMTFFLFMVPPPEREIHKPWCQYLANLFLASSYPISLKLLAIS